MLNGGGVILGRCPHQQMADRVLGVVFESLVAQNSQFGRVV